MVLVIQIIFFLSLFMIFYVYVGYPILVFILSIFNKHPVRKATYEPFVTIIIAAYNEEECIANTLDNKLQLDYPKDKLEIIVVSDGSTDETDDIVHRYELQGVRLLQQEPRAGKTAAINMAVAQAAGEILVFADANSIYAPDALQNLIRNFADAEVGYVTGKMVYINEDGSLVGEGCSAYMKYENILRTLETNIGSVVGVDGGVDAVRKELYEPMNQDQLPDFVLPLKVAEKGYRVVYESEALLKEYSLKQASDEYKMRVRVSLRALWALFDMRHLLGFRKNVLFAWQLWSHKVLRYLCFLFLITLAVSNLMVLGKNGWYWLFLLAQASGYVCAIGEPLFAQRGWNNSVVRFVRYFVLINLAAAHACVKFISGQKQVLWTPRKG